MTKRLFIAINIDSEIKNKVAELLFQLKKYNHNKPVKWVEDDNLHLTLHFLGETEEEKIDEIIQSIQPVAGRSACLKLQLTSNIKAFPTLYDPKVIYLEIKDLAEPTARNLQIKIGEALEKIGFAIDKRPFNLHLTLGRVKAKTELAIPDIKLTETNFSIDSVDLMESKLTEIGPEYSCLKKILTQSN